MGLVGECKFQSLHKKVRNRRIKFLQKYHRITATKLHIQLNKPIRNSECKFTQNCKTFNRNVRLNFEVNLTKVILCLGKGLIVGTWFLSLYLWNWIFVKFLFLTYFHCIYWCMVCFLIFLFLLFYIFFFSLILFLLFFWLFSVLFSFNFFSKLIYLFP